MIGTGQVSTSTQRGRKPKSSTHKKKRQTSDAAKHSATYGDSDKEQSLTHALLEGRVEASKTHRFAPFFLVSSLRHPQAAAGTKPSSRALIHTDVYAANAVGTEPRGRGDGTRVSGTLFNSLSVSPPPTILDPPPPVGSQQTVFRWDSEERERKGRDVGGKSGSHAQRQRVGGGGRGKRETGERDRSENYSNGVRWGEEEGVGGTKRVRRREGGGRKRGSNSLVEKEWISHRPFFPFI